VSEQEIFTDAAAQQSLRRAMRLGVVMAAIALPIFWWKTGWQGAAEFAAGAAISLSGLREWRRLMTALMEHMAAAEADKSTNAAKPKAMGPVLAGFFIRLAVAVAVLYVSLKYLQGPVIAVVAGLAIGVAALTIEALRLLKSWTK
jgi:hypothetical protein